jgi:hypothetical protein
VTYWDDCSLRYFAPAVGKSSLRSRRQHKAWGVSPRKTQRQPSPARETGGSGSPSSILFASIRRIVFRPLTRAPLNPGHFTWGLRPRLYALVRSADYLSSPVFNRRVTGKKPRANRPLTARCPITHTTRTTRNGSAQAARVAARYTRRRLRRCRRHNRGHERHRYCRGNS